MKAKRFRAMKIRHEVRVLKFDNGHETDLRPVDIEDITELLAEVERLRDALAFYADEANYELQAVGAPWDGCTPEIPAIEDGGDQAREALGSV